MPPLRRALLTCVFILGTAAAARIPLSIAIQPLGKVGEANVREVKADIAATFVCRVTVLPEVPLPQAAYYSPRNRYRAEKLVSFIDAHTPGSYDKVIGLTRKDISTTKGTFPDWGIFGYAEIGGRACVVSTYRLKFHKPDARLLRRRLRVLTLHEIGHTLGLRHCPTRGCIMQDCKGTIRTVDASNGTYCRACRSEIKRYLRGRQRSSVSGAKRKKTPTAKPASGQASSAHTTRGTMAAASRRSCI